MKTLAFAAALTVGLSSAPASLSIVQAASITGTWRLRTNDNWSRRDGERWVSIQMRGEDGGRFGLSLPLSDLESAGLRGEAWSASGVRFSLRRDAGTIEFRGDFASGRGVGEFTFAPNAEFVREMQGRGRALSADDVLRLAIHDVSRTFIQSIEAQGYRDLDIDELVRMRIHGVDAEYIIALRKAGYDKLSTEDLIKSRIHGATPAFVEEMRGAGFDKLSMEDLVQMRIHGVSAEFVKEMRALGYKDLDIDDLVRMRIHGVTPQFIRELKELGFGDVREERLVQFRIHGVTPSFIREVRAAGFKNMTAEDLVQMSIHGRRWLEKR